MAPITTQPTNSGIPGLQGGTPLVKGKVPVSNVSISHADNPLVQAFHAAKTVTNDVKTGVANKFNNVADFIKNVTGPLTYAGGQDNIKGLTLLKGDQLKQMDTNERTASNNAVGNAVGIPAVESIPVSKDGGKPKVTPKTNAIKSSTNDNTIAGYNLDSYATYGNAIPAVRGFYDQYKSADFNNPQVVQGEIDRLMKTNNAANPPTTPITGSIIVHAANKYGVDPKVLFSLIRQESSVGLHMASPNNPANVGNTDVKDNSNYKTIQEGVEAAARELYRRKI